MQAAGRSGKPETVLWSVRENQGIPWASINAASSFTVMEPSDSMDLDGVFSTFIETDGDNAPEPPPEASQALAQAV